MNKKRSGMITLVAMVVLAMLAYSVMLQAQRPTARSAASHGSRRGAVDERLTGFMVGIHTIAATGVTIDGGGNRPFRTNFGPGVGAMVAYGVTPMFTVYTSLDLAKQGSGLSDIDGSFGLAHFEVGARAHLPVGNSANVPYVSASVGHRAVGAHVTSQEDDEEGDLSFSGMMFGVGAGLRHFLSPTLSLDGGVELGYGKFGTFEADGEKMSGNVNATSTVRLRAGLNWRP